VSVVLTIVPTVGEAEVIAALLRTEGILCAFPETPWWSDYGSTVGGGYEIRVAETDYERARELMEAGESA
jgi:hypothetical protein